MKRIRWAARIVYGMVALYLVIGIAVGFRNVVPDSVYGLTDLPSESHGSSKVALNCVHMLKAHLSSEEIEHAITASPERVLSKCVQHFSLDEMPEILEHSKSSGKPYLLFFYPSLPEPCFSPPDSRRRFIPNSAGVAALAVNKAIELVGQNHPVEIYACRLSRVGPMPADVLRQIKHKFGLPEAAICPSLSLVIQQGRMLSWNDETWASHIERLPSHVQNYTQWLHDTLTTGAVDTQCTGLGG